VKVRPPGGDPVRQIPRDETSGRGVGSGPEDGILPAFWKKSLLHQGAEVHALIEPGEPDLRWSKGAQETPGRQQTSEYGVPAERDLRAALELPERGMGAAVLRPLEGIAQMAEACSL